mmetsp:Transcript_123894/g.300821  ORF Transcript_123894/g.300821 Transcript_123894/m.300821 type:complete len:220 (-) Transcript_123894:444-1103(-)
MQANDHVVVILQLDAMQHLQRVQAEYHYLVGGGVVAPGARVEPRPAPRGARREAAAVGLPEAHQALAPRSAGHEHLAAQGRGGQRLAALEQHHGVNIVVLVASSLGQRPFVRWLKLLRVSLLLLLAARALLLGRGLPQGPRLLLPLDPVLDPLRRHGVGVQGSLGHVLQSAHSPERKKRIGRIGCPQLHDVDAAPLVGHEEPAAAVGGQRADLLRVGVA